MLFPSLVVSCVPAVAGIPAIVCVPLVPDVLTVAGLPTIAGVPGSTVTYVYQLLFGYYFFVQTNTNFL
jgi:hypothetical protein